ncbi:MAG: hypothetical protein JO131_07505 [Gammaproteobacteria bacterium]|nr:hypothetical protein [Gammaproteobacteria bacterium]
MQSHMNAQERLFYKIKMDFIEYMNGSLLDIQTINYVTKLYFDKYYRDNEDYSLLYTVGENLMKLASPTKEDINKIFEKVNAHIKLQSAENMEKKELTPSPQPLSPLIIAKLKATQLVEENYSKMNIQEKKEYLKELKIMYYKLQDIASTNNSRKRKQEKSGQLLSIDKSLNWSISHYIHLIKSILMQDLLQNIVPKRQEIESQLIPAINNNPINLPELKFSTSYELIKKTIAQAGSDALKNNKEVEGAANQLFKKAEDIISGMKQNTQTIERTVKVLKEKWAKETIDWNLNSYIRPKNFSIPPETEEVSVFVDRYFKK